MNTVKKNNKKRLTKEQRAEVIRQLNGNISVRKISSNTGIASSTVQRISNSLKKEKEDITVTAEILTDTKNHLDDLQSKYDVEKFQEILKKSVKITDKSEEIKTMLKNGIGGLLEANLIGASAVSTNVIENIKKGIVNSDDVMNMVAINNNATKVGESFIEKTKEDILNEQVQDEQIVFDFDEATNENEATNAYLDMMK